MREKAINAYIFIVLVLFNVLSLNLDILGLKLENFLLLIMAIGVFVVISIPKCKQGLEWKKISTIDWSMGILCIASIGKSFYKLATQGFCRDEDILLLVLLLSYFIICTYQGRYCNYLLVFSVANIIIYIALIYNSIATTEQLFVGGYLLQGQGLLSWLVLSIVTGIIGYCKNKHLYVWYAVQVLVGSFLLFLQKNFVSIGIVGAFFLIVLAIAPLTLDLIRKVGVLLLAYLLLFANMSLIVNYTDFLKNPVPYSMNVSVYVELVLAVVSLVFYVCWNKWNKNQESKDFVLKTIRKIVKILLIVANIGMIIIICCGDVIKSMEILSKISNYLQGCFESNTGIVLTLLDSCGFIGIIIVVYFIGVMAKHVWNWKNEGVINEQWIYVVLGVVYLLQILCLNQSVKVILLYIFILLCSIKKKYDR